MNRKIGIAVSVYDKFDDLAILHDILRENFEHEYFLSVHCNHPDAEKELLQKRDLDIDHLSCGEQIRYRENTQLYLRILNSFKKSCEAAIESCDYVMHLHADAWPLKEEKIHEVIDKLEEKERKIAVRGKGTTYQLNTGYRNGLVMDQFLIFDSDYFQSIDFFEFDLLDPLPHRGIHESLMLLLLGKVGRSKMYFYSYMDEDIYWNGESRSLTSDSEVRPSTYDPEWSLFHCARDSFLQDYGKQVQANRLRKSGIENGEHVKDLLETCQKSEEKLVGELERIEKRQNRSLRMLLFDPDRFGKRFARKKEILEEPYTSKAKYLLENLLKKAYYGSNRVIFSLLPYENRAKKPGRPSLYSNWPKRDHEIYEAELRTDEIDAEIDDSWFRDEKS